MERRRAAQLHLPRTGPANPLLAYKRKERKPLHLCDVQIRQVVQVHRDDAEAESWIATERSEYERKCEENRKVIDTLKNEIAGLNCRRTSLLKVEDKPEFAERQAEILMDRSLVKEYINEKITSLVNKTYTFEEFNDIAAARGWLGEFKPYEF